MSAIAFDQTVPILRIFSVDKAKEFYLDYLGFALAWEHRFADDLPLYMQVSRGALHLHLTEHHGDACPGSTVFVRMLVSKHSIGSWRPRASAICGRGSKRRHGVRG
jgi:catechol 2,3-dioxygenase-like lactoylglutathione lyase family enzyme